MSIPSEISRLLATKEVPELGPGPRPGTWSEPELDQKMKETFAGSPMSSDRLPLVRALILLWHDHLDAAHRIAQDIEGPDGAWVHGIMHRREPDYGNAKYWFRRVGQHACFPQLAERASALLKNKGSGDLTLLAKDDWNAFGFVDACEQAAASRDVERTQTLREIQKIETEVLLERFCA